jgi:hypothetical protein
MRSRKDYKLCRSQVHQWALSRLLESKLAKDRGRLCTAVMVLNIVLRAAARSFSIHAVCGDLSKAPTGEAVMTAIEKGLPKTRLVLENRINHALVGDLPKRLKRRAWRVAIDYHEVPYYGQPQKTKNQFRRSKPKQGTSKFHTYATACIVQEGRRYTIALTWVRASDSMVRVLGRLIERIRELGLKIKYLLVDRAFFNIAVISWLKAERIKFLMPVVIRGRRPKPGRKATGLRWIRRQKAGWYSHTLKHKNQEIPVSICVGYRTHKNRKDKKRKQQKLLFAAFGVRGTPTEIRERYRKRFGIETSYRQLRQAKIFTTTRDPHLRLFFVGVGLLLRNLWVWLHHLHLSEGPEQNLKLHLERLRFRQMLDWISHEIVNLLNDS